MYVFSWEHALLASGTGSAGSWGRTQMRGPNSRSPLKLPQPASNVPSTTPARSRRLQRLTRARPMRRPPMWVFGPAQSNDAGRGRSSAMCPYRVTGSTRPRFRFVRGSASERRDLLDASRAALGASLPGRLPVPHALPELLPLLLRPLAEALAEVGARRLVETLAERVREELGQLLGLELAIGLDAADRLRQSHQGGAVAEGVEDLSIDVAGALARQVDHERSHLVRIALGAAGL